jgi:pyruvate dehydrogenase E1 component beta subunit
MAKLNMVQAINLALHQEMERDPSVIVLGEDVGLDEGVFRVTVGLHQKFGEGRVLDTPLAESGIAGAAIGMALGGLRPVAEIQFDGFSYLILPQLEGHASRLRSRTQGQRSVPLVIRFPYGGGVRALEHHSEAREVLYAHLPGLKVVAPSGPRNARALLVAAIRDPDPVVYMEPKALYRAFKEEVPEETESLPLGQAQVVREGRDVSLVAWGSMVHRSLQAAEEVEKRRGARVEVVDLLSLAPLDGETLVRSIGKTGRAVVVQESPRSYGPAAEIIARVNDRILDRLEAPVARVSGFDVVTPYFGREKAFIPDTGRIARALESTLDYR